jgi:hypothetical protein
MPDKEHEKKLDKELKETFPASDPTTGNVFVGEPTKEEKKKSCCGCGNTH